MHPTVSVLIPCHNGAPFLAQAIESAVSQVDGKAEVIVVDDGSTDASLEIMTKFHPRIRSTTGPNRGASSARNRAMALSASDYCVFLDADDFFEGPFLKNQLEAAVSRNADFVFGHSRMFWPNGRSLHRKPLQIGSSVDAALSAVLTSGWYPPNAILWRRKFLVEIGGWDECLTRNEDGELISRALLNSANYTSSNTGCAVYRQHNQTLRVSSRRDEQALMSNYKIGLSLYERISEDTNLPLAKRALAWSMLELAREAYECEHTEIGKRAENLSRSLGYYGNHGSIFHRLFSGVLGLRSKTNLAKRLRRSK